MKKFIALLLPALLFTACSPTTTQTPQSSGAEWIYPVESADTAGLYILWEDAVSETSTIKLYLDAEDVSLGYETDHEWLLVYESPDGIYPLFPREQLWHSVVSCEVFDERFNDENENLHVLVKIYRPTHSYQLYDCVWDSAKRAFERIKIYDMQGIWMITESARALPVRAYGSITPAAPIRIYSMYLQDATEHSSMKVTSVEELRRLSEAFFPDGELNTSTRGYVSGDDIPMWDPPLKSLYTEIFANEAYDEAFFDESFIMFISVDEASGSNRPIINAVTRKDGRLTVNIHTLRPYIGTDNVGGWTLVLELDKQWGGLDADVTRTHELWIPGSEDWPDTPGALEGKNPEDEAYRMESFLAAVDAFWRGDAEELQKYYFHPEDVEGLMEGFKEKFGMEVMDEVVQGILVPERIDRPAWGYYGALAYHHPVFEQYDEFGECFFLLIGPQYYVVNGQLKMTLSTTLTTAE